MRCAKPKHNFLNKISEIEQHIVPHFSYTSYFNTLLVFCTFILKYLSICTRLCGARGESVRTPHLCLPQRGQQGRLPFPFRAAQPPRELLFAAFSPFLHFSSLFHSTWVTSYRLWFHRGNMFHVSVLGLIIAPLLRITHSAGKFMMSNRQKKHRPSTFSRRWFKEAGNSDKEWSWSLRLTAQRS